VIGTTFSRLKWAAVAALIAGLALAAGACGDDNGDDDPTPTEEVTETSDPGDGPTASPTAEPVNTTVTLTMQEFVILLNNGRARRGTVTFVAQNGGETAHELVVIRTDIEKDELPRQANDQGVDETDLEILARMDPVEPGGEGQLAVDFEDEGTYVLICNLNSGGESHYLEGMYADFDITSTAPLDTLTPGATQ
jgi:uncharacterized cupredoxin-like copper-binding protein